MVRLEKPLLFGDMSLKILIQTFKVLKSWDIYKICKVLCNKHSNDKRQNKWEIKWLKCQICRGYNYRYNRIRII